MGSTRGGLRWIAAMRAVKSCENSTKRIQRRPPKAYMNKYAECVNIRLFKAGQAFRRPRLSPIFPITQSI